MQSLYRKHVAWLAVMLAITPLAFIGCQGPTSDNADTVKALPASAMRFHKPKELKDAINRMRQLHDAIVSSEALPEPIQYQVKEVIHGTGASGHSHYYLHDSDSDDKRESDHGHETVGEIVHDVSIDAFVELKDLAKWLPKIASDSNMGESKWSKVNEVSKQLTPTLTEVVERSSEAGERRASYGKQAATISGQLLTLEELTR